MDIHSFCPKVAFASEAVTTEAHAQDAERNCPKRFSGKDGKLYVRSCP